MSIISLCLEGFSNKLILITDFIHLKIMGILQHTA